MSGDSTGPPPGFGPADDVGSHEPPGEPPPPSFGGGDRQASSGDRPAGGHGDDSSQDRHVFQSDSGSRGQSERGGATHHEWNTHDDVEHVYEPVLHHWRTEQPNDFTRHEWNMGTGVDRSWGDGRVYYDDRGDFAEESTGYGRRTSWDTTTANSTSDGRPRR